MYLTNSLYCIYFQIHPSQRNYLVMYSRYQFGIDILASRYSIHFLVCSTEYTYNSHTQTVLFLSLPPFDSGGYLVSALLHYRRVAVALTFSHTAHLTSAGLIDQSKTGCSQLVIHINQDLHWLSLESRNDKPLICTNNSSIKSPSYSALNQR